jgi:hypothetical protein
LRGFSTGAELCCISDLSLCECLVLEENKLVVVEEEGGTCTIHAKWCGKNTIISCYTWSLRRRDEAPGKELEERATADQTLESNDCLRKTTRLLTPGKDSNDGSWECRYVASATAAGKAERRTPPSPPSQQLFHGPACSSSSGVSVEGHSFLDFTTRVSSSCPLPLLREGSAGGAISAHRHVEDQQLQSRERKSRGVDARLRCYGYPLWPKVQKNKLLLLQIIVSSCCISLFIEKC